MATNKAVTNNINIDAASAALARTRAFIDGVWVDVAQSFAVTNPATGAEIAQVADCTAAETERAIAAAAAAQPAWAAMLARDRAKIMRAWYNLILENAPAIAAIITAENGKPLAEAMNEVQYGADFIDWYAEEGKRVCGATLPATRAGQRFFTLRQPVGVCGLITPWNFPFSQVTKKLGAALAAGCTVVLKPAEQTPLSALLLAELAQQAGLPAGVLNIVPTAQPAAVGGALMASAVVRKVSFTGSTDIGRLLMRQAADTLKKVTLELGGNSPFIVFDDADIDAAVAGVMASKFRNAGQTCVCANRVFVHENVYAAFAGKLVAEVKQLKLGNGAEAGTTTGPLIDMAGFAKVCDLVAEALQAGARALVGGRPATLSGLGGGTFYEPTVIEGATPAMRIMHEEIFGPVLPLYKFSDEAAVTAEANNTNYGLAAYVFTRDYARVQRMAENLHYGVVAINTGVSSSEAAPFGGLKESGFGKEGGREGLDDYLVTKFIPVAIG